MSADVFYLSRPSALDAARRAARRILAELADDGVTDAAVRDAELAAVSLERFADNADALTRAADLRLALAELASRPGLGVNGALALARLRRLRVTR